MGASVIVLFACTETASIIIVLCSLEPLVD